MQSPARRARFVSDLQPHKPQLTKRPSKIGQWFSNARERLVMKIVCCTPGSVVMELEAEDTDFHQSADPIKPSDHSESLQMGRRKETVQCQKSASIVPMLPSTDRCDIPTNEELASLPIDLSFMFDDDDDEERLASNSPVADAHAQLLSRILQQQCARHIQRQWRAFLAHQNACNRKTALSASTTSSTGDKTGVEGDNESNGKPRRRRIRKHRGRKKKTQC